MTPPLLTDLATTSFDPELSPGAYNAVNTCLRIQPSEKVTVITDVANREIAASIVKELLKVGSPFNSFVLEELADRPLTGLPAETRSRIRGMIQVRDAVRVNGVLYAVGYGSNEFSADTAVLWSSTCAAPIAVSTLSFSTAKTLAAKIRSMKTATIGFMGILPGRASIAHIRFHLGECRFLSATRQGLF